MDRVDLDLDVGSAILPKIGLECYLDQLPGFEPRWQLFLDELVKDGVCIPEKRDALLSYEGISNEKSASALFCSFEKQGGKPWNTTDTSTNY